MMPAPARFAHPSTRPLRVLLADDNHDSTDSLAQLLVFNGCAVQVSYDGRAVLPLAEQFLPDVCVLDVRMPGLDGWTVAAQLREWAGDRLLLLVALTGFSGRQAEERSRDAGFDHHILKPGDLQTLYNYFTTFARRMEPTELAIARLPIGGGDLGNTTRTGFDYLTYSATEIRGLPHTRTR